MTSFKIQSFRIDTTQYSAALCSWIVALACVTCSQSAYAQSAAEHADAVRQMSADDLEFFARLPVPTQQRSAACCPACPESADCASCPKSGDQNGPSQAVAKEESAFPSTGPVDGCHCPECIEQREAKHKSLVTALSQLPLTSSSYIENYVVPASQLESTNLYCEQMVEMLFGNLKNLDPDDPAFKNSIDTAIKMVNYSAQIELKSQLAQSQLNYQKEMSFLRGQIDQMSNQANVARVVNSWLSTLYANQNRCDQQIRYLLANTASLSQAVEGMERNLARQPATTVHSAHGKLQPVQQAELVEEDPGEEIQALRIQLQRIEARLQQIRSSSTVRPATHLEPIYDTKKQLMPIPAGVSNVPGTDYGQRR